MPIFKAITVDLSILNANKAFSADCYTETKFAKEMELGSILQLESVIFLIVKGVRIPWDCFPSPSPTRKPCFCIILKAKFYLSSSLLISVVICIAESSVISAPSFSY